MTESQWEWFRNMLRSQGITDPKKQDAILEKAKNLSSRCNQCQGLIAKYWHYCGHCGLRLPLPENLQLLGIQELTTQEHVKISRENQRGGFKFCIYSGVKL